MMNSLIYILSPVIVAVVVLFLIVRLRFFRDEQVSGRVSFLSGGIVAFIGTVWQLLRLSSDYSDWFVDSAYQYIDLVQYLLVGLGILLMTIGLALYADFWQSRHEEVDQREKRLGLLDDLRRSTAGQYPLVELLNITLKEILGRLSDCSGAVFVVNKARRQYILSSSVGLTRQETSLLEYYPVEQSIVTQAIDLGEGMLGGEFLMVDRSGHREASRFQSSLVLPLVAGHEKIGAIVILAVEDRFFDQPDLKQLMPIAQWLSDRIHSMRLERTVLTERKRADQLQSERSDLTARLLATSSAFVSRDPLTTFCQSLNGFYGASNVHIIGLVNGTLHFYGSSDSQTDLTENYRIALVEALGRSKPLVINQEATAQDDSKYIASSTLVFPMGGKAENTALLLRREETAFSIDEHDLKLIEIFSHLARPLLKLDDSNRLNITRRRGFEAILQLLRFDNELSSEMMIEQFVKRLTRVLPDESRVLLLETLEDSAFRAVDLPFGMQNSSEVIISSTEGEIGESLVAVDARSWFGRKEIERVLSDLVSSNRETLYRLTGERGLPSLLSVCPFSTLSKPSGAVVVMIWDTTECDRGEWERMLTLATSLFSMQLTTRALSLRQLNSDISGVDSHLLGNSVNKLNNYFAAIIGQAELAINADAGSQATVHLRGVLAEAEKAASYVKESLGQISDLSAIDSYQPNLSVSEIVQEALQPMHVSERMYMIAGRPREVNCEFEDDLITGLSEEKISLLTEEVLSRFGALLSDDDLLSMSTYRQDGYCYLDISRHRKNFPPVDKVAKFGKYQPPEEVLQYRPIDAFLTHIVDTDIQYAYDGLSQIPSYLSFRFPSTVDQTAQGERANRPVRLLAIDDQDVILDLIAAMCQSLGYQVETARNGEEGVELAQAQAFDIILTDLAMPGISGLETAERIKKLHPTTPIILITGWEVSIEADELKKVGISSVLSKPFRMEQLTDLIQSYLSVRTSA